MTAPARDIPALPSPMGDPAEWTPRIAGVLDRQISLYAELDQLSVSQAAIIEAEDSDALLTVLARRQNLIEGVERLNDELGPFRQQWDVLAPRLSEPQRQTLRQRLDRIAHLVELIAARDEADRRAMETRRARLSVEMGTASKARGAVAAYAAGGRAPAPSPRFQDHQG